MIDQHCHPFSYFQQVDPCDEVTVRDFGFLFTEADSHDDSEQSEDNKLKYNPTGPAIVRHELHSMGFLNARKYLESFQRIRSGFESYKGLSGMTINVSKLYV